MLLSRISKTQLLIVFCLGIVAVYMALFLLYDGLRFPMIWDEDDFWGTTVLFGDRLIPSLDLLRNYDQLNTPLPFIIFGALEYFTQDGLFAGRLLNLSLSAIITFTIGVPLPGKRKQSVLAACGLLLFPYYLWLSSHFYTDIIATFCVFAGVWFYLRNQHIVASLWFVLAIASRQFMLAFPAAIAAYEFVSAVLIARQSNSFKTGWLTMQQTSMCWLAPSVAAMTLLGWIWFFGGLAPQSSFDIRPAPTVQTTTWAIALDSSLYFLSCIGLYFVIPEWFFFNRSLDWRSLLTAKNTGIALSILVLLIIFPPLIAHGLLIKVARSLPLHGLQLVLFFSLASLACIRFSRVNLAFWLLLSNSVLMLKAFPWDKYTLPLLVVLWYLRAINALDADHKAVRDRGVGHDPALNLSE